MRGFGHPVRFDYPRSKCLFQLEQDSLWHRRGTGANKTKTVASDDFFVGRRPSEDGLVHGGYSGVPSWVEGLHPPEKSFGIKVWCAGDTSASGQRCEDASDKAMNVKEGHHVKAAILLGQLKHQGDVMARTADLCLS